MPAYKCYRIAFLIHGCKTSCFVSRPQTEAIRQVSTDVSFIFIWFTTTKNISALIIRKKEDSEGLGVTGTISINPVVIIPPLYVEIKGQLDATDWFFIAKLIKFYSHQLKHFFIQLCISLLSYIKIT